jgi:transcription antitermination factor NusG
MSFGDVTEVAKLCLPGADSAFVKEANWLVFYVIVRHEKTVSRQLADRGVEHYLPLYDSARRWKDRKVVVSMPMFDGYVFARCSPADRNRVLGINAVVRCLSSQGAPVVIPDDEFARMRNLFETQNAQPYPYLEAGKRVRLWGGALEGFEGRYIRRKGKHRAIVQLDHIMRAVLVDVDVADLRVVH